MFIAMVSATTTTTKQVVYNTKWVLAFFIYILRARISSGCIEIFNLESKKSTTKKNTVPRTPSSHRPAWSPRITRGGPRGRKLCPLTPYPPGVRKEDINLLNILLLLLRNLLPQQHATTSSLLPAICDPVVPGRRLKVGFEPISIISCCCRHVDCSISYLSTNHKIEFYYDRERHITRVKLYNLMLYIPQGRQHIFGPALLTWLLSKLLPYSHYYHMSNQQFWRA